MSLCKYAVWPEPSLLACTKYGVDEDFDGMLIFSVY